VDRNARFAAECIASFLHPILNHVLDQNGFDDYVEELCSAFYAPTMGRPSLAPGRHFRLLLLGFFEEIESERGIAWRAADSLSVRAFLGLELDEAPPDHSTISRTRRLIDLETHRPVFTWVLERLSRAGLVNGETIGIDATTLEANAALRSIVRRDTGETYETFLIGLAKASRIETPTREDLARLDRKRPKKGSNDDSVIRKRSKRRFITAAQNIETVSPQSDAIRELVGDKGYHSNELLKDLRALGDSQLHCRAQSGAHRLGR
jgi:transposase